jgi:hypothetical protein
MITSSVLELFGLWISSSEFNGLLEVVSNWMKYSLLNSALADRVFHNGLGLQFKHYLSRRRCKFIARQPHCMHCSLLHWTVRSHRYRDWRNSWWNRPTAKRQQQNSNNNFRLRHAKMKQTINCRVQFDVDACNEVFIDGRTFRQPQKHEEQRNNNQSDGMRKTISTFLFLLHWHVVND